MKITRYEGATGVWSVYPFKANLSSQSFCWGRDDLWKYNNPIYPSSVGGIKRCQN